MYEDNDLYNLDLDEETSEQATEPTSEEQQTEQYDQRAEQRAQPQRQEPRYEQAQGEKAYSNKREISEEQYAYLERAQQKEELSQVVDSIKARIPGYDFDLVAKELLKMSEQEVARYYTPQGLEILWYERFTNRTNNAQVDSARNYSDFNMSDTASRLAKGEAEMDEEMAFYQALGKIR